MKTTSELHWRFSPVALVLVAFVQLSGLKKQLVEAANDAKTGQSGGPQEYSSVIQRAENDPILQQAYETIADITKGTSDYSKTKSCKYYVNIILNYYEERAIVDSDPISSPLLSSRRDPRRALALEPYAVRA